MPAAVLRLQRSAGNGAVSAALQQVQRDTVGDYIAQAWKAAWRGGVTVALAALLYKPVAAQNAADHVGYGYHLGPGDALRHCTWSALVMSAAISEEMLSRNPPASARSREDIVAAARVRALGVLMAHEEIGDTGAPDSLMDQHNNSVGIGLTAAAFSTHAPGSISQQNLVAAARGALDGGALTMFNPATGERVSTSGWAGFRTPGSDDPWVSAVPPRAPAPAQP